MHQGRTRAPAPTTALIAFGLVGLGTLATALSVREERQTVRLVDERAADLVTSEIRGALSSTVAALRGADGLAADGVVNQPEFDGFARGLTGDKLFQAVAYATIVPESDRAAFQARTGLAIKDTDGHGGFVAGADRARSLVVSIVSPLDASNRGVLGFDLASDPVRLSAALAAERTGLPAIAGPIRTVTQAKPGVAVVSAVRTPDGTTVGFVSSGIDMASVMQRADVDTTSFADFRVDLDGTPLVEGTRRGTTRTFELAGHEFSITVHKDTGFDPVVPILIGSGTLAVLAAASFAMRRDRRQRIQISLAARRSRGTNDLGQALVGATDVRAVMEEVLRRGPSIMDAAVVAVSLIDLERPTHVISRVAGAASRDRHRTSDGELADRRPATECIRTGKDIAVAKRSEFATRFPAASDEARIDGIESALWVPLTFGRDICMGSLGFGWTSGMRRSTLEERRLAARTVADLTSRAIERAITTATVQAAADNLGALARQLAAASDSAGVQDAVHTFAAAVIGARESILDLDTTALFEPSSTSVARAIVDRRGERVGRLVLKWQWAPILGSAQNATLDAMAEMIGQTLERTALTDQEHEVIAQLQRSLLPTPPAIAHLDVAVRYEPAMSVVGLGGDFYDVIVRDDDRVFLVIGDVTGHGSEAVATMAELKAVLQSQLRNGRSLEAVCDEADRLLARRGMYATIQIVQIDQHQRRIQFVNAGHPYPVLHRAGAGTELLTAGHQALLGLGSRRTSSTTASVPFGPGDTLVLYTDGLIERRDQPLDTGMQFLVDLVDAGCAQGDVAALVDAVIGSCRQSGNGDKTDDDMAVLAVRPLA